MNRNQRFANRRTARANMIEDPCPECGAREKHWIGMPTSLQDIFDGTPSQGFWTCAKFYGADGRRLESA